MFKKLEQLGFRNLQEKLEKVNVFLFNFNFFVFSKILGRSRGFAFVVFVEVDTLTTVLSQDHAIKGKKVAVKKVIIFYKN